MRGRTIAVMVVSLVVLILGGASLYTVQEGQQAVITQFGKPVAVATEAGLKVKVPFIQVVNRLEKRLLPWDGEPANMQTKDKKRIFIDIWARWRIVDPMKFFQALHSERRGYEILDALVDSAVRDVVARYDLIEVVRSTNRELMYESEELTRESGAGREAVIIGRSGMEAEILKEASSDLEKGYGMELTKVHVKRVNYIESVRMAVYLRMKAERLRIAELFKSEAIQEQNRIIGRTNKELDQIMGEMERRSAEIRGDADAAVISIAAEAYSKSPEFYKFLRRLEAYKKTLGKNTRLILSTKSEFLQQLHSTHEGN